MKEIKVALVSTLLLSSLLLVANGMEAEAANATLNSNGVVSFVPNNDQTLPVDPNNPDPTNPVEPIDPTDPTGPNPGTSGPLSLDYASSLYFGENKISNVDETYYADAQSFDGQLAGQHRGNYVQVTDSRGSLAGWTLTVAQKNQFKSDTAKKYKELAGAEIKLSQGVAASSSFDAEAAPKVSDIILDPEGAASAVMSAKAGQGAGTWVNQFGSAEEMTIAGVKVQKNKAVTLAVPGATPKEATEYKTTLVWTLSDIPGV